MALGKVYEKLALKLTQWGESGLWRIGDGSGGGGGGGLCGDLFIFWRRWLMCVVYC